MSAQYVFEKMWNKVDMDGNGTLSVDELRAASKCLTDGGFPMGSVISSLLKNADISKDGQVTRGEWDTYVKLLKYPDSVLQRIEETVEKMDLRDVQTVITKLQNNIPTGWVKTKSDENKTCYTNSDLGIQVYSAEETWERNLIQVPPTGFLQVPSRSRPGQFSYYHKASGIRVENVEQAWALKMKIDDSVAMRECVSDTKGNTLPVPVMKYQHEEEIRSIPRPPLPPRRRKTMESMKEDARSLNAGDASFPGVRFVDAEFPPCGSSLGTVYEEDRSSRLRISKAQKDAVKWIPLPELVRMAFPNKTPCLFDDLIEPNDLTQGQVGDCWLLASIAGLAEFPNMVRELFCADYNEEGKYTIKLFDLSANQWEYVTIDDSVPCTYEEDWSECVEYENEKGQMVFRTPSADWVAPKRWVPLFARLHSEEIWTQLLEKSVAKFCGGSYANIAGGIEAFAYIMFTGFPVVYVFQRTRSGPDAETADAGSWERGQSQYDPVKGKTKPVCGYRKLDDYPAMDNDHVFQKIASYDQRNYLMGASITAFTQPASIKGYFRKDGLVLGHAYSLITASCVDETLPDGTIKTWKMILLRNPHGPGSSTHPTEWNQRWSDTSTLWQEHPQVAQELNFNPLDDGLFWMELSDFCAIFDKIQILAKSMDEPRTREALERRGRREEVGVAMQSLQNADNMNDYRRVTVSIDPFTNAPKWVADQGLDGRIKWFAEKGTLDAFLAMNPCLKERAESVLQKQAK